MAWLSTPSIAARSRRLMSRTWASRSGVGVIKKKRRGCCDEKTGAICAPGADCSAREGTKIRNSAPSAKKPTTFARKRSAFRRNRPTFFSFCARCVCTSTTLCRKPTSGRGKRPRTAHKNTFLSPKCALTIRKCFTHDSTPPQNNGKTTSFGLHLSTTDPKARQHAAPNKNKALKMSAFPIFICTFAER